MFWRNNGRAPHPALWWIWGIIVATLIIYAHGKSGLQFSIPIAVATSAALMSYRAVIPQHRRQILRFAILASSVFLLIRLIVAITFGVPIPGNPLFTLPELRLPSFLVGIRIGGPVTRERLSAVFVESLTFISLIITFATVQAFTTPLKLLRVLPARFYGLGLALAMATSIAPRTAASFTRVRNAQRLRGHNEGGLERIRRITMPVLEESLERSIDLAQSLESRGYGRGNTSRYRPEHWSANENIVLAGALLALILIPHLALPAIVVALLTSLSLSIAVVLT